MEWGSKAGLLDFSQCKGLAEAATQAASAGGRAAKKPKTAASGGVGVGSHKQVTTCSVDGCGSDLSGCRDYHRRHKVCEAHAKTPVVTVGGKQQRFCQQCSRFHLLVEFDEGKRSCRKRLDCHNRRRRKPQTQPPLVYSRGGLLPGHHQIHHQGQLFAPYPDASQAARPKHDWGGLVQGGEDNSCLNFGSLNPPTIAKTGSAPYPHLHERKQLLPFSQSNGTVITGGVAAAAAETSNESLSSSRSSKLLLHQMNFFDPERAPSLLSPPPPPPMQVSSVVMAHVVPVGANPAPPAFQPPLPSIPHMDSLGKCASLQDPGAVSLTGLSCLDAESNEATTILVPDTGSSDFSSIPIFDVAGADGSSDGTSQDIPFYWN